VQESVERYSTAAGRQALCPDEDMLVHRYVGPEAPKPGELSRLIIRRPEGDFLIDYHPSYTGLFLASGGSGDGVKFFPVIGGKIADAIEGKLDRSLRDLWAWPPQSAPGFAGTEDGSRSGLKGLILEEELGKGSKSKL